MSQEDKLKEIKNIMEQLKLLSIQQSELVNRLERLTNEEKPIPKKIAATPKLAAATNQSLPKRALVIGDKVRIVSTTQGACNPPPERSSS